MGKSTRWIETATDGRGYLEVFAVPTVCGKLPIPDLLLWEHEEGHPTQRSAESGCRRLPSAAVFHVNSESHVLVLPTKEHVASVVQDVHENVEIAPTSKKLDFSRLAQPEIRRWKSFVDDFEDESGSDSHDASLKTPAKVRRAFSIA